ncbi:MAG: aspartate carbamoyltransferase regulatory subunit [Clostridia bacterium]|nr:aspartate carbamoyltransferase regulatory subunit [Clostridia bacterium]
MINVSEIKDGVVLDHIPCGQGYSIFKHLKLDTLDAVVVLLRNVYSEKYGKKDIIKIETNMDIDVDVLGLLAPGITVSYIHNGEQVKKVKLTLPEKVVGTLSCKNPRCVTNIEKIDDIVFTLADKEKKEYSCEYCETRTKM